MPCNGFERAAGRAVVAHPGRYRVSRPDLRRFLAEFQAAGGEGIEVITGSHTPEQYGEYARVAREFGFLASRGSDFHGPTESHVDLGRLPSLPAELKPVWHDWRFASLVAQYFVVHPTHPQPRLIARAAKIVRAGGVIAYPTDSCYALGCRTGDKDAMLRLRHIRGVDTRHHFTLMCRDLSELATYARVDNARYRLLKSLTPGSYTFILEATRELPRRVMHPQRRTIGLRVPDHAVACALLEELDEPLLSTTLHLPGDELASE